MKRRKIIVVKPDLTKAPNFVHRAELLHGTGTGLHGETKRKRKPRANKTDRWLGDETAEQA